MGSRHVVVDGSNLATEGRSLPSLAQLDEAVRAYKEEWPDDDVLVVVDASFSYRIDESERAMFEGAESAGEVVSPPAGAIGRGDGFLLRIADRTDAVVLSNDSFQEFHGEYPWLFEEGRLIGGKPVPGVGWIFTPRSPVRGPKSRVAVRDAKTKRRAAPVEPVAQAIAEATAEASAPAPATSRRSGRRRGRSAGPSEPEAVNEPLPFITFIAEHHLGTEVEGTVDSFTSHGAFIVADGARCYAPVVGLGDPPPRSAKDVLKRGESRMFVVQALDPPRRGIELALPGLAKVAGAPTEETVEAEMDVGAQPSRRRRAGRKATEKRTDDPVPAAELPPVAAPPAAEPAPEPVAAAVGPGPRRNTARRSRTARASTVAPVAGEESPAPEPAAPVAKVRRAPARKAAAPAAGGGAVGTAPAAEPGAAPAAGKAGKAAARKRAAETVPAPVPDAASVESDVPAEKASRRKAVAKKGAAGEPQAEAPPKRARARKAAAETAPAEGAAAEPQADAAPKRARARKAPAETAPADGAPAKKAAARKSPAKKVAADGVPAEKEQARRAVAEKAPAGTQDEGAPAKKAAAKGPAKKGAAKKAAVKKGAAKKAAAPSG